MPPPVQKPNHCLQPSNHTDLRNRFAKSSVNLVFGPPTKVFLKGGSSLNQGISSSILLPTFRLRPQRKKVKFTRQTFFESLGGQEAHCEPSKDGSFMWQNEP